MKHWLAVPALVLGLCLALTGLSAQAIAKGTGNKKQAKTKVFEACKHGCKFNTIQKAVNAAGSFKFKKANAKVKAIVAVKPGKYVEGVVVDGTLKKKSFDGLTIEGTKKDRKKAILEGKNAKGELGA